ncbi:MAG: hypothetical protein C4293_12980, partial [Nitrospiraceae bacterium]
AADLFEVPCLEGVALDRLDTIREARIFSHRWITSFTEEAASWLTKFLPRRLQARRLERRLREDIEYLSARNIGELRWTMSQNIEEAFRRFESRMEAQCDATISALRASVQAALQRQAQRESRHEPALDRLEVHAQKLVESLTLLSPPDQAASYGLPV